MKYIFVTLISLWLTATSFGQSIDSIVHHIADSTSSMKTDSLAGTLDSSVTYTKMTSDATPLNVDTLFAPRNTSYQYTITIVCANTANGDVCNGMVNVIIKNVNDKVTIFRQASVMTMSCQGTISSARYAIGSTGIITITGVKNITMKWVVRVQEVIHVSVP